MIMFSRRNFRRDFLFVDCITFYYNELNPCVFKFIKNILILILQYEYMQIPIPDYIIKSVIWKINGDGSKKHSLYYESDNIFTRHGYYKAVEIGMNIGSHFFGKDPK